MAAAGVDSSHLTSLAIAHGALGGAPAAALAVRAGGSAAAAARLGGALEVWTRAAAGGGYGLAQSIAPRAPGAEPEMIEWAPHEACQGGDALAAVCADGSVAVYAGAAPGQMRLVATLTDCKATCAAFAPAGGVMGLALALGGADGAVYVYVAEEGHADDWLLQGVIDGAVPAAAGAGGVSCLAWSAGTSPTPGLVVGGGGGAAVWALCGALNRWNAVASLGCGACEGGCTAVAWAENIRARNVETVAVASADGVRVYEVRGSADAAAIDATEREASDPSCAAGAPLMHAHAADAASSLDFDAAGAQLAAGFPEGEVRLFAVNALGEWGDFSSVAL